MKEISPSATDPSSKYDGSSEKPVTNPLSRKITKILETRLENDKTAVEALKELSTFFPENTLRARRNLRGQIERRTVTINQEFVAALQEVTEAVDAIYTDVKAINAQCSEMKGKLQAAKTETKHLTEQTARLHKQREVLEMQQQVATAFSSTFLLTPDEVSCLKSNTPNIGPAFFAALDKTQTVRNNTKHLLQTGQQTTALDVMSHSSEVREAGIAALYQWLLQQARHSDTVTATVPTAMAYLEDRPQLFKLVVEEWVVVRRGALNRQFLHSLTHLSPTHSPIELGAHSPTRYVGDMLAWLHQALAGEREVMGALFGACRSVDVGSETSSSVSSIAESVCRPLKTRVEQMIVSSDHHNARTSVGAASAGHAAVSSTGGANRQLVQDGAAGDRKPVLLYKMSGLLQFYTNTILQLTGPGVLVSTLDDLQQLSYKMFLAALHTQVEVGCERLPQPPPPSLSPAAGVTSLLTLLTDIITAATLVTHHEHDHAGQVVEMVVAPLLVALSNSCAGAGPVEASVYLLNCYQQLHSTVSLLNTANTQHRLREIEEATQRALQQLTQQQVSAVLASLGLLPFLRHLTAADGGGGEGATGLSATPMARLPDCSPQALHAFLIKLDQFLSSPDSYLLSPLRMLLSTAHRQHCLQHTCSALLHHYTALYHLVHSSPRAGYNNPDKLMPKTPDMVKALMVL